MRSNLRKEYRVALNLNAICFDFFTNKWNDCEIYDLSTNGVALRINQYLLEGDKVKVKIDFENDYYTFEGIVVYSNGIRVGIKFLDISYHQIEFLEKMVEKNLNKPRSYVMNQFPLSKK